MSGVGYGPLWRVDGPPPQPPLHRLLDAARIVDDADSAGVERWGNGVKVYPYPPSAGGVWDACAGSSRGTKAIGPPVPLPEFGAVTAYVGETCSSYAIYGSGSSEAEAQTRYVSRATAVLAAIESSLVEKEFMGGDVLGLNPHLADGQGTVIGTATGVVKAFALLENEIALTGRRGIIHCSPAIATYARSAQLITAPDQNNVRDVLLTVNGTPVVPGYGYVGVSRPPGHPAPSATQEYIYATGPVDVRRSDVFVTPDNVSQALDRTGSLTGHPNSIAYFAERYFVVDWDTILQVAVLTDWTL